MANLFNAFGKYACIFLPADVSLPRSFSRLNMPTAGNKADVVTCRPCITIHPRRFKFILGTVDINLIKYGDIGCV